MKPVSQEFGKPSPEWFRVAEVYNGWYNEWNDDVVKTRLKGFPLIVGVPHKKEWIDKAHEQGVKVIPYISFYKALAIADAVEGSWKKAPGMGNPADGYISPFWKEMDLSKHPEWMLYNEAGEVRRPFDHKPYAAGWQQVCTNAPGYVDAALRGVRKLLDLDGDGLFIDNVHATVDCFGAKLGKHKHVEPEKNNKETYKQLLQKVYDIVKNEYGQNKLIMLNSGADPEYWPYGDAMMHESYICSRASVERLNDWGPIIERAKRGKDALAHGKVIVALSYVRNTSPNIKGDAFFCYACAKLSGFHWADWFTIPQDNPAQELFTLRLGQPTSEMLETNGVHFRWFEKGLVIVNPAESEKELSISPVALASLRDVYAQTMVKADGGSLSLVIPAQSGRVLTTK